MWYVVAIRDVINEIKEKKMKKCYDNAKMANENCQSLCEITLWFNSDADFLPNYCIEGCSEKKNQSQRSHLLSSPRTVCCEK